MALKLMKIWLKIASLIGAALVGGLAVFLLIVTYLNFALLLLFDGNEFLVQFFNLFIFFLVTFLVFKKLDKLLQQKFSTNQNKSAT
ncbi:hypothetical protein [Balneola vulgaris]|uniref:hypothetical protein n=1 Tax=Balneola vulgaris TaxID=287535 RepID=UPI0012F99E74|nr:hypothetical protein [Balneola vulgaris]